MAVVVGIPACAIASKGQVHHSAPARYGAALLDVAGCVPVLIPPVGEPPSLRRLRRRLPRTTAPNLSRIKVFLLLFLQKKKSCSF